ncbi:hypothetical protein Leryth_004572 [Lithospermum erythrorhizon]|nr:hypothetical protein Leryth_004572 [Lithospermum erythrorhizon]
MLRFGLDKKCVNWVFYQGTWDTWHQEEYEVSPMTEKSTNKRNVPAKPMASDISLNSQSKCKISIWNSLG